ncbi:MAG: ATP-binding cassette domain-containing protein [Burkholderiales bacterium]|nr:ATP-binding cassette domain-containing protein [Burkholderiales bacterium]
MAEHDTTLTISAHGLSRAFGTQTVVNAINLELRRGEVLGFLGPNGAGKTTTMQMLTGNLAPSSGSISICGIDLLDHPVAAKAKIGYLPETPPLYRDLKVDEYLVLAARLHRVPKAGQRDAVDSAKHRCGLNDVGGKLIGALSKGFQQRVGIAQAIVHGPDVVILDEPTVGLDPNQIREIRSLIRELGGKHSVILSTHILPEVEAVCDRVQIMHHGNLVYSDSITALQQFHGSRTLLLGLRRPPPVQELAAVPGIATVEPVSETLFSIQSVADHDPTDTLTRLAAEKNWGLYQLNPAQASIEDVFANLTRHEENT